MRNQTPPPSAGRSSYLLLVALLPPMGTLVMVVYFFSRLAPALEAHGVPEAMAIRLIAVGAGMSSIMAALALVVLLVMNRQRGRLERANKRLTEMVSSLIEERVRMTRNLEALNGANQVTLAIKQESSFERIATVVLEQIEFFSKATDIVVFAASRDGELDARARRLNGINSFGRDIDGDNLECELPYEALIKNAPCRVLESRTANYSIAIPYATQEGMKGVVMIRRNILEDPDFEADLANFEGALIQLVRLVSVGLKFASLWDRAIKDEMTGLYNKNHFNAELPRLMAATAKSGKPFSLIMLDIDKFKTINDQCGHLAGDHVLRQVSAILIDSLRDSDLAFRFGGEELCVVCNGTVAENAAKFAERLRQVIAHTEIRFDAGSLIPVSASFGVAEFNFETMDCENDLKDACDKALYEAKNGGRNVVVVFQGEDGFEIIERGGDVSSEVKRRLGLAGDNTPIADVTPTLDRRAPQVANAGNSGVAPAILQPNREASDPNNRPSAAESLRKVAEEIVAAVAGGDGSKLAEFAQIAGIAAAALSESRRVGGASVPEHGVSIEADSDDTDDEESAERNANRGIELSEQSSEKSPKRGRATRRKQVDRRVSSDAVVDDVVIDSEQSPMPRRRRGGRRAAPRIESESALSADEAPRASYDKASAPTANRDDVDLPALADQLKTLMAHVSRLQEAVTSQSRPAIEETREAISKTAKGASPTEPAIPTNQSTRVDVVMDVLPEAAEVEAKPTKPTRARKPRARKKQAAETAETPASEQAPGGEPTVSPKASNESDEMVAAIAVPKGSGELFGTGPSVSKSWQPKKHW